MMELLKIDPQRLEEIYKSHNTNNEQVKKDVEILKEWLKKQPHLPQELPYDRFLEQMLKNNKYRIERTKERIESYFTLKSLNLGIFQGLASDNSIFPTQTTIGIGLSPIFSENHENIVFVYFKSPDAFDFDKYLQAVIAFCEIYLRFNNAASLRFVCKMNNFSLSQIKKIDLVRFSNFIKLILDGYGFRLAGLEYYNLPIYCNPLIALIKSISSGKMIARIRIHDSLESLHKYVPKHVLPEELGGTATFTMKELADIGDSVLVNQQSFLADSVNYLSNEKLRIGKSKYDEMFGVDGTFKQINVD